MNVNKKKRNFFLDKILSEVLERKQKRDIYVPRRSSNHIRRRYSTRLGDVSRGGRGQIRHRPRAVTRKQCLMKITLAEYRITLPASTLFHTRTNYLACPARKRASHDTTLVCIRN